MALRRSRWHDRVAKALPGAVEAVTGLLELAEMTARSSRAGTQDLN